MADKTIGELTLAESLNDDSLLVAEQNGGAVAVKGKLLKDYAKEGVGALVTAAQESAAKAEEAAAEAQAIADSIKDVSADVEAAEQAAAAAQTAQAAAETARQAAEDAAALAAEQAAADAESKLQGYVNSAEQAKTDAEQAKADAQSAAEQAATDAAAQVDTKLAQYVADAQAAQKAAEQARDEAQAVSGGNFLPLAGGTMTGQITLSGEPTEDLHAASKKYVDDALKDVDADVTADEVTFEDGETFQQKYDSGELKGGDGVGIQSIEQTTTSTEDGGENVITVTLTDGVTETFAVKNGSKGSKGDPATINGVNALTLAAGDGVDVTQDGDMVTLSLGNHTQAASTITAGTFAGQVVANSSSQTPGTALLRNSKLVSADTTPTNEGEINWTYG